MKSLKGAAAGTAVFALISCAALREPVLAPDLEGAGLPPFHEISEAPFFPQTAHHCGPAALAAILAHSGIDADPAALSPMIYIPGRRGSLTVEMSAASRRLGRMPYLLGGDLADLVTEVRDGRPAAVLLNIGAPALPRWHYAVVVGYDGRRDEIILRSGRVRRKVMTASRFLGAWDGGGRWALVVLAPGDVPVTAKPLPFARQAAALEEAGMTAEAEAAYRRAIELWPQEPLFPLGLGNTLGSLGRLEEAEEEYLRLLQIDPDSVVGLNNLAHVLSLRGCHEQAAVVIEKALRQAAATDLESTVTATAREIRERRDDGSGKYGGCRE